VFVFLGMPYPVLKIIDVLRTKLRESKVVILQAPPGAGKSTALPIQIMDEEWLEGRKIIMLEPRRLATRAVAMRMSHMLQQEVGTSVGYRVRFDTCVSNQTKIEVVTEGILTRMIQHDNSLSEAGLLIFDEFHERSLHADTALALAIQVQQVLRPDLRILIMSATLDSERLSTILGNAPIITATGRQFPVDVNYLSPDQHIPLAQQVSKAIRKAYHAHFGDILVFLPGTGDIHKLQSLLEAENMDAEIFPLYGDLPYKKQQEAILPSPSGRRKIVLATSIAETSLTIEGIAIVIDSGYARVPRFNPKSGLTTLETIRVTKDSAEQRAGRAGRLGPGVCYRLWSEAIHANLIPQRIPEIVEADLAPLLLELFEWGIKTPEELTWITTPPIGAVNQAKELLKQLKAIDQDHITPRGKTMLRLPTHPRLAHMLLEAENIASEQAVTVATDLAALLEERDPLGRDAGRDISLRIDVLRKWRNRERVQGDTNVLEKIEKLASAWRKLLKVKLQNDRVEETLVGRLIMEAYPERIAKQVEKGSNRYRLANGRVAKLPDHDPLLKEKWLAIAHLDAGMGEGNIFTAAPLSEEDLLEIAESREQIRWDDNRQMLIAETEKHVSGLVIMARPLQNISEELRINALLRVIREQGLKILGWSDSQHAWQARVMSLKIWRPNEAWPDVSDESLLRTADQWLSPFLLNITKGSELLKLALHEILPTILPWELSSKLDLLVPAKMEVPSGSMIAIQYFQDGRPPVMEVRLQEVFGLTETPAVNEGRTKIIMHLLSPGFKPVQVTQDLKSFWNNTYAEVRKELRTRYPKHSWPDDPWTAQAIRGAKKRHQ
jgi:ATP-dependent helicase HrpB